MTVMKQGELREPTIREKWILRSGEIQKDVNHVLHDVQLEIEAANVRLAELYDTDPEAAGELAEEIVEYLDNQWDYSGDVFMVSGKWYMPTIGIGPDGILAKQQYEEVCRSAHSNGFIVKPIETGEDDVVPRVGLSFVVGSAQILSPSLQGGLNFLAYADTSDVTVQFLRPGNNEVVSSDPAQVWKSLRDADSLLYLYTNHPGSTFYKLNAKKQERFVRDIIDAAEQTFPAADAYDQAFIHDAELHTIFYKKDGEIVSGGSGDSKFIISGAILGVTLVDIFGHGFGKQYSAPDDLHAVKSGLCLIVRPEQANFPMESNEFEHILLPLRSLCGDATKLSIR